MLAVVQVAPIALAATVLLQLEDKVTRPDLGKQVFRVDDDVDITQIHLHTGVALVNDI